MMLSLAAPAIAAPATPAATALNTNLVKNGGAEGGQASSDGIRHVNIPGWTTGSGYFTVVKYGTTGFPTTAEGNRIHGGKQFFATGPQVPSAGNACDTAWQDIVVTGLDSQIDSSHIQIHLKAMLASPGTSHDDAWVEAAFYSGSSSLVGSIAFARWATHNRFTTDQRVWTLPHGTRRIRVTLSESQHDGGYCNAYFEKVSVKLTSI